MLRRDDELLPLGLLLPRARADLFVLTRRSSATAIPVEIAIGIGNHRSIAGRGGGVLTS
jgi:hypothetical protein